MTRVVTCMRCQTTSVPYLNVWDDLGTGWDANGRQRRHCAQMYFCIVHIESWQEIQGQGLRHNLWLAGTGRHSDGKHKTCVQRGHQLGEMAAGVLRDQAAMHTCEPTPRSLERPCTPVSQQQQALMRTSTSKLCINTTDSHALQTHTTNTLAGCANLWWSKSRIILTWVCLLHGWQTHKHTCTHTHTHKHACAHTQHPTETDSADEKF